MSSSEITDVDQLYALRRQSDLSLVRLHTGRLKRRNVLRYALKYALFAVAPGGRIEIVDDGPSTFDVRAFEMPFGIVRQQCFKTLGEDVRLVELDEPGLRMVFERVRLLPKPGWSAGIVFSGNSGELPFLRKAVEGLRAQAELAPEIGGEILICAPQASAPILAGFDGIRHIAVEEASDVRAFTTRKKNALIAAARNPRIVVLHARIVLQPGCLAAFPREFDVSACRVEYREGGQTIPYLDWIVTDLRDGDILPRQLPSSIFYDRDRHLDRLRSGGRPYVDGGAFFAMTAVARATPLNPHLAWGEAEDVEWCERLQTAGMLVDLNPDALALSQSYKLSRRMLRQPRLAAATAPIRRITRCALAALRSAGRR